MADLKAIPPGVSESQVTRRLLVLTLVVFKGVAGSAPPPPGGGERCAHAPCSPATEAPEWTVGVRRAVRGGTSRRRTSFATSAIAPHDVQSQVPNRVGGN